MAPNNHGKITLPVAEVEPKKIVLGGYPIEKESREKFQLNSSPLTGWQFPPHVKSSWLLNSILCPPGLISHDDV
tara:strand:+ start:290 stop:511 length:222 start_codon:yes stop_codon:yes gene_type:complete